MTESAKVSGPLFDSRCPPRTSGRDNHVMDFGSLITGAVLLSAGAVFQALVDARRRRSEAATERSRRIEERAEDAAGDLIVHLDDIYESYTALQDPLGEPEDIDDLMAQVRRKSVLIPDVEVRRRLDLIYEALQRTGAIASFQGDTPRQIAVRATRVGTETLSAYLRHEALPADAAILDEYHSAVVEENEAFEESRRQEIERRRRAD